MNLPVCQLRKREAREYELHGKKPNCKTHGHISVGKAQAWVRRSTHRWVLEGWWIVCDIAHWAAKTSGGMRVQQLVEGVEPGRAPGRKYEIAANGAHGRATSVMQTNGVQQRSEDGQFVRQWV